MTTLASKRSEPWEDELLERGLQCAVCIDQLCEPVTLGCGHTFCRLCLVQAARLAPSGQRCPKCRALVELKDPATEPVDRTVEAQVRALVPQEAFEARAAADAKKLKALETPRHSLPIFYMRGAPSRPGEMVRLHLFEPRYKLLARRAAVGNRLFLCTQQPPGAGDSALVVRIEQVAFSEDGRANICGRGVAAASLQRVWIEKGSEGLYCAEVEGEGALSGHISPPEAGTSGVAPAQRGEWARGEVSELPVFYLSRGAGVGESVQLKFFEPRYRNLARQAWGSHSRLFIYASSVPHVGDRATLVRMQACRWDNEGSAHVVGVGVAAATLEAVREDGSRLYHARCRLPVDDPADGDDDRSSRRVVPMVGSNGCCSVQ